MDIVGTEEGQVDAGEPMEYLGFQVKPVTHEVRRYEGGCYEHRLNEGSSFF